MTHVTVSVSAHQVSLTVWADGDDIATTLREAYSRACAQIEGADEPVADVEALAVSTALNQAAEAWRAIPGTDVPRFLRERAAARLHHGEMHAP